MSTGARRSRLLAGLFVGGRGERLGGVEKGLLRAPRSPFTLIERALIELRAAEPSAEIALVGRAEAYAHLGLPVVQDDPPGIGPLGGLIGLLAEGQRRSAERVLVLACDLPFVERHVLGRLATEADGAAALVALTGGVRNPLVARYAPAQALPAARQVLQAGKRSLQAVLDALGAQVAVLTLSDDEGASLRDWDTPEDLEP